MTHDAESKNRDERIKNTVNMTYEMFDERGP